jgi:nucleoside-diphosphate-sugar epimerase
MTKLVLLTGAAGFVGRQVLQELAARKCRVRVVVRQGKQQRIAQSAAIEKIIATPDLWAESAAWCADVCRGVDTVIHVAWYAEPGVYLQSPKNRDCLAGTMRLAHGAIEDKVRRFVGVGTCFEYDPSASLLSIQTPLRPSTPYADAKASAFTQLSQLLPQHGIEFAWCRLFYLYGEGEDARRLVPYLHARLSAGEPAELTSGEQIRDYMDVRDAGRMIVDTAFGAVQGPVNICSGIPTTIRLLAERIADEYGRRDLLCFGARPANTADPPCIVGVRAES